MIHKRVTLATVAGLTAALALSACGGSSDTALNTSGGSQVAQDLSQANPDAQDGGGDVAGGGSGSGGSEGSGKSRQAGVITSELRAKKTKTMGTVVVDGDGRTMYRFDKDKNDPAVSNCYGDCAVQWPPVLVDDAPELRGVDQRLVGSVKRKDGSEQLTLKGWPLYRYAKDKKEGDWKGHGVNGVWWAITSTGGKAKKCLPGQNSGGSSSSSGSSSSGSNSGSGGGYSSGGGY